MRIKLFLFFAGLFLVVAAACTSGESVTIVPSDELGTLAGSVNIGPLCPVEPCSSQIDDTYSSRELILRSERGSDIDDILVYLNQDGTFQTPLPIGHYEVSLSNCEFLGCSSSLPVNIEIVKGETFDLNVDIDTGIRSAVQPPSPDTRPDSDIGNAVISDKADTTARRELGARLGFLPESLRLVSSKSIEFSSGSMGCPEPGFSYTQAIIPGYIALYEVDGLRYPFHVSLDGRLFTDCRGENNVAVPFRVADDIVTVDDAFRLGSGTASHLGQEIVLKTLDEAEAYLAESNGLVEMNLDLVDWDTEMLVGTVITGSGCSFDLVAPLVLMQHLGKTVTVNVSAVQTGMCEKAWAAPVWLAVQEVPKDYSASFLLSYAIN